MTAIIVLVVIVSIFLIIAVLVQNPKGGGLSSEFGGGATSQMFGVQRTGNLIENLTWGFFAIMVIGALTTGVFFSAETAATGVSTDLDVESSQTVPVAPAPVMPSAPAPAAPTQEPAQ